MPTSNKTFTLVGSDGKPYSSLSRGTFGGHRGSKLYGRLDCRAGLRAIASGGYVRHRVFFADEATAIAAGYRPCAICMPQEYAAWKKSQTAKNSSRLRHQAARAADCDDETGMDDEGGPALLPRRNKRNAAWPAANSGRNETVARLREWPGS